MTHLSDTHIGHFMVAVGAIIEHQASGNILVVKRDADFQNGMWEIVYGRIDQFEELDEALRREVQEEVGITELEIKRLSRVWHIHRGEKSADNEVYGFTFHCVTTDLKVRISDEHSAYEWVSPAHALEMITSPSIKADVQFFVDNMTDPKIAVSDKETHNRFIF